MIVTIVSAIAGADGGSTAATAPASATWMFAQVFVVFCATLGSLVCLGKAKA